MKKRMLLCLIALALVGSARATAPYFYTVNATIADNDLNGYQNSQTISGLSGTIADVTVNLNITGGFNGDFYLYLEHNNTLAVLLNRAGLSGTNSVGYPDAGFSITLDDTAANDVHFYRASSYGLNGSGQLTGTWLPDGRLIDPLSAGSAFASAPRGNLLSGFDGADPNGTWTLFAADVSAGGVSILQGWGLAITVVPEPGSAVLIGCGLACVLVRTLGGRRSGCQSAGQRGGFPSFHR